MNATYWYDLAEVMDAIIIITIGLVACGYLTAIVSNLIENRCAGDGKDTDEGEPEVCLHCEIDHNVCMDCGEVVELDCGEDNPGFGER
jgi:hypothetical protein